MTALLTCACWGWNKEADGRILLDAVALPANILSALSLVRTASKWMSGLFLTSTVLTFLCIPVIVAPLLRSKADSKGNHEALRYGTLLTTLTALLITLTTFTTTAATVIATAMFVIFRNVFSNVALDLNIGAQLGTRMFVFMWLAVGLDLVGMLMQWALCCCYRRQGKRRSKRAVEEKRGVDGSGDGMRRRVAAEGDKDHNTDFPRH